MQVYNILKDKYGRELTKHGDPDFPCAGYDESFSKFTLGEVPWHWHDEIEIVIVYNGTAKVEHIGGEAVLSLNDGILINANALHRLTQVGNIECKIINFVLKPDFLSGSSETRIFRDFIAPICRNKSLNIFSLTPAVSWQKEALKQIKTAFRAYTDGEFGFELVVLSRLIEFWRLICFNERDILQSRTKISMDEKRTMEILQFIETHYMKRVSVAELASVAGISESECYRLFSRTLNYTPGEYLLKYRLQIASGMLKDSNKSILEIALDTGFNSSAYFTKRFKENYHLTPRDFRKKNERI